MKKISIYILVLGSLAFLFGCGAKLQTYDLSEEYAIGMLNQPVPEGKEEAPEATAKGGLVGVPAMNFYSGDLKRGGIWWAKEGIVLEKGEVFTITATNIGPDNTPFGATFPPLNLAAKPLKLKITARAEGIDSASTPMDAPTLYLQVSDMDGFQTNEKRPFNKIENSTEFKDYYFDLKDIYNQSVPEKRKVNGGMISGLKLFINPGQSGYTGKIIIKEIRIIPAESN